MPSLGPPYPAPDPAGPPPLHPPRSPADRPGGGGPAGASHVARRPPKPNTLEDEGHKALLRARASLYFGPPRGAAEPGGGGDGGGDGGGGEEAPGGGQGQRGGPAGAAAAGAPGAAAAGDGAAAGAAAAARVHAPGGPLRRRAGEPLPPRSCPDPAVFVANLRKHAEEISKMQVGR